MHVIQGTDTVFTLQCTMIKVLSKYVVGKASVPTGIVIFPNKGKMDDQAA
jgi:hypothetical protein